MSDNIVIENSVENLTDGELGMRLQTAASAQVSALNVLGEVEAQVSYLEHFVEREIDRGVQDLMLNDPHTTKSLGGGRNSLSPLKLYVLDNNDELADLDEELAESRAILARLKKYTDAITAYRETLSRQVAIRDTEVKKGMRI